MKVIYQVWNFIGNRTLPTIKLKLRDLLPKFKSGLQSQMVEEGTTNFDTPSSRCPSRVEIGRQLREARDASGQKLEDISKSLRIKYEFLESIEQGNYDSLPGLTYTMGFIKSYAQFLELDVNDSIALFKTQADILEPTNETVFPVPPSNGIIPNLAVLGAALLITTGGYILWNNINKRSLDPLHAARAIHRDGAPHQIETSGLEDKYRQKEPLPTIDQSQVVTNQTAKLSPRKIRADSQIKSDNKNKKIKPASGTNDIREEILSTEKAPAEKTYYGKYTTNKKKKRAYNSKIEHKVISQTAKIIGPETSHEISELIIKATADSWVEISTSTSDVLVSRVMAAGELVTISDNRDLYLSTGNINALVIEFNGTVIEGFDRSDRIVKNISLNLHRP